MSQIYILTSDQQQIPYDIKQLRSMWTKGEVSPDTFFWKEGETEWKPLKAIAAELEPGLTPVPSNQIYILGKNQEQIAYDTKQLRAMWAKGEVKPSTFFWREGETEWKPLRTIATELDKESAPATIRMNLPLEKKREVAAKIARKAQSKGTAPPTPRKKKTFIIFGSTLGLFGAHNFYLGYQVKGGLQLIISLGLIISAICLTPIFILGLLAIVGWVITDILMTQQDAFGERMED